MEIFICCKALQSLDSRGDVSWQHTNTDHVQVLQQQTSSSQICVCVVCAVYRSAYCAASVASLTNILTPKLFEDTTHWILRYVSRILF